MLIIEIADYIKITRQTVSKRLQVIRKEVQQQLGDNGFGVWDIVYDLKRDIEFVKRVVGQFQIKSKISSTLNYY